MKRTTLVALTAALALTCATSAHAGLNASNGLSTNALTENALTGNALTGNALTGNALTGNALTENAITENAITENGVTENGVSSQALIVPAPSAYAPVPMTVFAITLPDGSVLVAAQ